jgi:4-hydroxy-3-methylbut-2-en-1-yl diphosphate synthase IspG/GcpE
MSLISCSECAREVSDRAFACPACGNPMLEIDAGSPTAHSSRTVKIEATGKKYKALELAGAAAISVAVVSCSVGAPNNSQWSGLVFVIGAALYGYGRVGAWWNHG